MSTDMFLYWASGSPASWQVMIMLEEKALQGYGQKILAFNKKEQKSEEMLKLNPRGQLPVFRHGDVIINESMATSMYLESMFSSQGTKLIPDEQAKKAKVLQLTHEALNLLTNALPLIRYNMFTKEEDQDPEELKKLKETFLKEMNHWETYFAKIGDGYYIDGEGFSMADVVFFPRLALMYRHGIQSSRFPRLAAYFDKISQRPSVKATWPPHWKDSPNQTLFGDGSYIDGDSFSMADVAFIPRLALMFRLGIQSSHFPRLAAYFDKISQRPSVKGTWPPYWKDSPNQTLFSDF